MVVAIDGPAGSGKSTVAKIVSEKLNLTYLNSGLMYRAVTKRSIEKGQTDPVALVLLAKEISFSVAEQRLLVDGLDPRTQLHTPEIDSRVGEVSSIPELRLYINDQIRSIAKHHDLLVEGRDTTTVMFPETKYKYFIDASPRVRAERRFAQGLSSLTLSEIESEIIKRDHIDRNKPVGALVVSKDALYIDSSVLTIAEVCDIVIESIQGK